jgi:hypothetical protein
MLSDQINGEIDRRKLEKLQDDGLDLSNAPIYVIEPTCKCNDGLEGDPLACAKCGKLGEATEEL